MTKLKFQYVLLYSLLKHVLEASELVFLEYRYFFSIIRLHHQYSAKERTHHKKPFSLPGIFPFLQDPHSIKADTPFSPNNSIQTVKAYFFSLSYL